MTPALSPLGAGLTVTSGREARAERPDVTGQAGPGAVQKRKGGQSA